MKLVKFSGLRFAGLLSAVVMTGAFAGCVTTAAKPDVPSGDIPSAKAIKSDEDFAANAEAAKAHAAALATLPTIRVKAGLDEALTDSKGNVWAADNGFEGGETVDRPDIKITGTDRPELYHSEHYAMTSYSAKVSNGEYVVSLHYSEDYDGITDDKGRVFTYAVKDGDPASGKTVKEVKDFSPWKAAGAQYQAYVDKVPVTVTSGEISVVFTAQTENPQINAIEIAPK